MKKPPMHPQRGTDHWSLGSNATPCPPREEWHAEGKKEAARIKADIAARKVQR